MVVTIVPSVEMLVVTVLLLLVRVAMTLYNRWFLVPGNEGKASM